MGAAKRTGAATTKTVARVQRRQSGREPTQVRSDRSGRGYLEEVTGREESVYKIAKQSGADIERLATGEEAETVEGGQKGEARHRQRRCGEHRRAERNINQGS